MSVYLPLYWRTLRPVPPIRNQLPMDAVAHTTIPFTEGLSRMPMIKSHLVSPAPTVPPQSLIDNTYSPLKEMIREALLGEWPRLFPTPGHCHHPPALSPRPFMGLDKFIAGRIHQMTAGKSSLAAHPTWRTPDAYASCPRCSLEPETFEHAILAGPSRQGGRSHLLHGVTSVGHDAPLSSSRSLRKRLATFIGPPSTGFPPTIFLPDTPPSFPPRPLLPLTVPSPAFRVFSLPEV